MQGQSMGMMPKITGETSNQFRRVVVDGIFGHVDSIGLDAILFSEFNDIDEVLETATLSANRAKIKRVVEIELIMSPMQMMATYQWLGKKIKEYEALYARIPSPEEVESRSRDMDKTE